MQEEEIDALPDYATEEAEANILTLSDYETERGKPMPNRVHAIIQTNLAFFLKLHYGNQFDIATELTLDLPDHPATPDLVVMEKRPLDLFDDTPRETTPPLVAIEIISPSQGFSVFKDKANRYFAFGIGSYWVIQPPFRTIYVFSGPQTYETFINSDVLRDASLGLEVPLTDIFG